MNKPPYIAAIAVLTGSFSGVTLAQGDADEPVKIEEVVVLGSYSASLKGAIDIQQEANRIMSVVDAEGIGKLPDRNAAEAVARVPGVSIERDQGEGRFAAVRGLPSQWNSTTLNGNRIPTAEEETTTRATAFDFFPTELIDRIEVSKAITPDMEGDAIGGAVNFVTRTAPDDTLFSISAASEYNDKTGGMGHSLNFVYGDKTEDGRFGFLINGTSWSREWATDNFEPRRTGVGVRRLELRDYVGERDTYGINAAAEFNPNESNRLFVRGQFGTLKDHELHYKHRYRFDKDRIELQHISNELITEFKTVELGGVHEFGGRSKLDWSLSNADNRFYYGCIPNCNDRAYFIIRFDQKNVGYRGLGDRNLSYNQIDGGSVPAYNPSTHLPDGFRMDPASTRLAWVELYQVDVKEKDKIVAQVNHQYEISDTISAKFGAKYRDKERIALFRDLFFRWNPSAGPAPTMADFALIDQPGRYGYDVNARNNYSNDFSQVIPEANFISWYNNNRNNLILDENESAIPSNGGSLGRNFDVFEEQTAAYAMAEWYATDKLEFVAGVRVERTDTQVKGQILTNNQNTGERLLEDSVVNKSYTSVLPQFHLLYRPNDETNIRMALTRTFARPDFGDINPGGTYVEHDQEFKSGNADLSPTYSTNLDLIYEWYFGYLDVLTAGVFYKRITDPVFETVSTGTYNGEDGVTFFRPQNGGDASLTGLEFSLIKTLDMLPGWMQHFGVNANVTIMSSKMQIDGRDDDPAIPRQADLLYNLALFYDTGDFSIRLASNYKGEYIAEHGSTSATDTYYGKFSTLDLSASYNVSDRFSIYGDLINLTDEPLVYYTGNKQRPNQVEFYGIRGRLGLRWTF